MIDSERKSHWEGVYTSKQDNEVGWFEEQPLTSYQLVQKYCKLKSDPLIDIGGGNSFLAKILHDKGFSDINVLDVSGKALQRNRSRFNNSVMVSWIENDVLNYKDEKKFIIWHDRAVFHFLTSPEEIKHYARTASHHILVGGHLIMGTFSRSGPSTCSGLPVMQYSFDSLLSVFEDHFEPVESFENTHTTPSGNRQDYLWAVFRKK
ncbi:MAG: SAM-dependent methyltransferase [bacterium]